MADDQDQDEKTEQPSQKRIDEAIEKGNVPNSRELGSFLLLAVFALLVAGFAPSIFHNTKLLLIPFLDSAYTLPTDQRGLGTLFTHLIFGSVVIIAAPLIASVIAAIASGLLQNGFLLTTHPLLPDYKRISLMAGIKRMFSMRSVVEFIKNLLKIGIVGYVAFIAVYPELVHVKQLPSGSMLAVRMTIGVTIAMFFIALFDVFYQRFVHTKSMRMTKQDVKDEHKQNEGNPVIKQRLRQLRMQRARKRMMLAVPKSDVVITNPTHFSVALQYDPKTMKAPQVVAKGQDHIALKIRELAREHNVPIVENPPLARALFSNADLDSEIPFAHYEAVAKVISYVYQLKGKKLP
jgi:flagellar biosynthesis protein FlhB